MASRKEQKEALRREREQREQAAKAAERRRRLIGYGAGGGLVAVALIVVVVLFVAGGGDSGADKETAQLLPSGGSVPDVKNTNLATAAKAADCVTKSHRATSRDHTSDVNQKVKYPTNPPAAGRHYQFPADDGLYDKAPKDVEVVHAQEHGRVVIWFKPSLPKSTRMQIRALFDKEKGYQLLVVPRANMPYQVAQTAWNAAPEPLGTGRLMGCPTVTDKTWDALQDFIQANRGNGPEAIP